MDSALGAPSLGWLLLAALVTYLVGGWLRADDEPNRTVMTFRDGWVILRPTWLYAAVLITILVALLVALGTPGKFVTVCPSEEKPPDPTRPPGACPHPGTSP